MATNRKPRNARTIRPVKSYLPKPIANDISIMGHLMPVKLAAGTFDALDSNTAAYMLNVCRVIAIKQGHKSAKIVCDMAMEAYVGIRRRHDRTGVYGATGPELVALRETLPEIAEYFATRSQHHLEEARRYVLRINEKMRAAGAIYAEPDKRVKDQHIQVQRTFPVAA